MSRISLSIVFIFCFQLVIAQTDTLWKKEFREFEKKIYSFPKKSVGSTGAEYIPKYKKDICPKGDSIYRCDYFVNHDRILEIDFNPYSGTDDIKAKEYAEANKCKLEIYYYGENYKVTIAKNAGACGKVITYFVRKEKDERRDFLFALYTEKTIDFEKSQKHLDSLQNVVGEKIRSNGDYKTAAVERDKADASNIKCKSELDSVNLLLQPYLWNNINLIWEELQCQTWSAPDSNSNFRLVYYEYFTNGLTKKDIESLGLPNANALCFIGDTTTYLVDDILTKYDSENYGSDDIIRKCYFPNGYYIISIEHRVDEAKIINQTFIYKRKTQN